MPAESSGLRLFLQSSGPGGGHVLCVVDVGVCVHGRQTDRQRGSDSKGTQAGKHCHTPPIQRPSLWSPEGPLWHQGPVPGVRLWWRTRWGGRRLLRRPEGTLECVGFPWNFISPSFSS